MDLTYEEWLEKYKPERNPDSGEPYMFETYGGDYDYVKAADRRKIWTLTDWDDDAECIQSGWHYVNRLGYYITEIPFEQDEEILIILRELYTNEGEEDQTEDQTDDQKDDVQISNSLDLNSELDQIEKLFPNLFKPTEET